MQYILGLEKIILFLCRYTEKRKERVDTVQSKTETRTNNSNTKKAQPKSVPESSSSYKKSKIRRAQSKEQLNNKPRKSAAVKSKNVALTKKSSLKKWTSFTIGSGNIYIPPKSQWPVTIVWFLPYMQN